MSPTALTNGSDRLELLLLTQKGPVNLALQDDELVVTRRKVGAVGSLKIANASSSSIKTFPYLQVLSARSIRAPADSTKARVKVSVIYSKAGNPSKLYTLEGDVHEVGHDREQRERGSCRVESWCEELMKRAYKHVKPRRRLRAVVNPHGGKGNAQQLFEQICQPIFAAAECSVTVVSTGPANSLTNAFNLGRDHDCSAFDVLVPVSGDGIVHELLNGIASRPDGLATLRSTPIAPVPAGSGNAISINLYGPSRANDCAWAALGAIKGSAIPMDLCSVTQKGKRYYSFLSQTFGLMADIDLGTEHLRFLADFRFIVGYVQGALARRTYPVELAVLIAPQGTDKKAMAQEYNDGLSKVAPAVDDTATDSGDTLPPLQFGTVEDELPAEARERVHNALPVNLEPGWHTIKTRLQSIYGGKLPFVSKDAMLFPPATGNNGLVDLAIVGNPTRVEALSGMDGAESGRVYHNPNTHYYRCSAYRLTPINPKGYIAIDGEKVDFAPLQVEVHQGLARVLSLSGRFFGERMDLE